MNTQKRVQDETIKDIRNVTTDMCKTLDVAFDTSKLIMTELMEYFKKRQEIENDYGTRLTRLGEKFGEKIEKISSLLQFEENGPDKRYEGLTLLKTMETELKTRASATLNFSDKISNTILPISTKYNDFHILKINKCKDILNALGENLIGEVNDTFLKRNDYARAVSVELKSTKVYNNAVAKRLKGKKSGPLEDQKMDKIKTTYINDVIQTDRCRNHYLLSHHSTISCQERLFMQQTSDIVLLANFKFGEFWSHYSSIFVEGLNQFTDSINKATLNFEGLRFSDAIESDVTLDRYRDKLMERSITMPLLFTKSDRTNKLMLTGPVKNEMRELAKATQEYIQTAVEELSRKITNLSAIKESQILWESESPPTEYSKENKNSSSRRPTPTKVLFEYNGYFKMAEEYMKLDTLMYHNKTKYAKLLQTLESPFEDQQTSFPMDLNDIKEKMKFGVDLVDHCMKNNIKIPAVVSICAQYLYSHHLLKTVGIFRLSPSAVSANEAKEELINMGNFKEGVDAFCVANIMKEYLRKMKNFITSNDILKKLSDISYYEPAIFIEEARNCLETLSIQARDLLIFIGKFLKYTSNFSDDNKMDLNNLSIVFGPTLFAHDISHDNAVDSQTDVNRFLKIFCDKVYEIYPNESVLFESEEDNLNNPKKEIIEIIEDVSEMDDASKSSSHMEQTFVVNPPLIRPRHSKLSPHSVDEDHMFTSSSASQSYICDINISDNENKPADNPP